MEFPPLEKIGKIWEPTTKELIGLYEKNIFAKFQHQLKEFFKDMNSKDNSASETERDPEMQRGPSFSELSIHLYLYTLIKKRDTCFSSDNQHDFIKEEAPILSVMLEKQGFIADVSDEPGCIICAIEKLQKDLMDLMKQQLEITKMASSFYTKPENENSYNICANHRPFNPNNCVPKASDVLKPTVREDIHFANNAQAQRSSSAQNENKDQLSSEEERNFLGITHSRATMATRAYLNDLGNQLSDNVPIPSVDPFQNSLPRLTVPSTSNQTLCQNMDPAANYVPANYNIPQDYLRNLESANYFAATQPVAQDSAAGYLNNYTAQNYAPNYKSKYVNQESGAQKTIAQDYVPINYPVAPNNSESGSYYVPANYMTSRGTAAHYVPAQDYSFNNVPTHMVGQESVPYYAPNPNSNMAQDYLLNNLAARANGAYFPNRSFVPNVPQANSRPTNTTPSSSGNFYDVGNSFLNLCIQPANPDPRDTRASPSVAPNMLQNHILTQTVNANPLRRAIFNRAVNNIVHEVDEQIKKYPGRKILGKKY